MQTITKSESSRCNSKHVQDHTSKNEQRICSKRHESYSPRLLRVSSIGLVIKLIWIGIIGLMLCAANAWAGPASIQGIVKDASGQPIKGADVRIESVDGKQFFKTVKTDARGRYVSQGLQLRVYRVTLLVNGVVKACITNIKTKQDQATELNLDLKRVAAVQATTEQKKAKNMVWVPARTGSHLGGNWVEVDEYGEAAFGSNIHTGTGEDLRRQQLTQPPGSVPGLGPTPPP